MPVPDFSPGEVLTAAAMDSIGLWLISTTTIGTGVTSVPVNNVFSANYNNYRIVINGGVTSAGSNMVLTLNGVTGSVYNNAGTFLNYASSLVNGFNQSSATNFVYGPGDTLMHSAIIEITNAFATTRKNIFANGASNNAQYAFSGYVNSTSSATGLTIAPATGGTTMTGGTIRVYGYRN